MQGSAGVENSSSRLLTQTFLLKARQITEYLKFNESKIITKIVTKSKRYLGDPFV
jgi:hypothetical protein